MAGRNGRPHTAAIAAVLLLLFVSLAVVSCDVQFTGGTAIQEVFEEELVNDDVSLHPTEGAVVAIRLVPDAGVPETELEYEVLIYRTSSNTLYRTVEVDSSYTLELHDLPRASYRIVGRALTEGGVAVEVGEASIKVSSNGAYAVIELKDVGHIMEHHGKVDATCTASGIIEHWHCTRCNLDFTDKEGLNYVSDTTIPVKGHSMVHVEARASTCTEKGTTDHWHCDRCGRDFSNEEGSNEFDEVLIDALGHDWSTEWSHDEHSHWHSCTRCSATGDVADHMMEVVDHRNATEDEAGWNLLGCSVCGYQRKDTIPPIKHSFVEVGRKEATCLEEGCITYRCSDCGKEYTETLARLSHSTTHESEHLATCTVDGNYEYWYCSTCGIYYSNEACSERFEDKGETVIPAEGHDWPTTWKKDSDSHWHTCRKCDEVEKYSHSYICKVETGEYLVSSATCTKPAIYRYSCVCGAKGSETFESTTCPAIGHELEHVQANAATCGDTGNIEYWRCTRTNCGKLFSDASGRVETSLEKVTIPATGDHVFTDDSHPSETYRDYGDDGHCHVCLSCSQPIGGAQRHDNASWWFDTQSHCRACSVCGHRFESSMEGHDFVSTEDGRGCKECPYVEKDDDPRSDSGFDVGIETNDPKCRLDIVDNGDHTHTFTCTNLIEGDHITEIRWYVDNVRLDVQATRTSIEVATPERRSYRVFCIYSNGKGYGSCEAVVTGY